MNIKKSIKNPTILIIICVFILLLPNFFAVFEAGDLPAAQFYESIAYGVFFWILWFALWKRAWLAILFASVPALWWAGSLFVRIKYQVPITQTFLSMVLNTPTREFFDFYLSYGWSWLFIAILIPIALLSLSFYLKIHPVTWSHRSRSLTIILGLSSIILMYIVIDLIGPQHDIFLLGQKKDPFQADTPQLWFDRLGSVYPLDFPIAAWQVYRNKQKTQLLRDTLPDIDVEPDIESTDRPDIVVMVIGESSRLDHWGLFGYNRQTTPSLQKQSGVLAFNNIVTQSISTRVVVPSLVSRKPFLLPHGPATNSVEPSILKAFEKSGYETYWLSNQSSSGFFENPVAFYAADAKHQSQLNSSSYSALGTYDAIVIEKTEKILTKKTSPVIIIIHTMGSHFNYAHRYPPEFDQYQPSLSPRKNVKRDGQGEEIEKIKNSYDNTILYTDFILNSLVNTVKKASENSVLLYISDHAEDIGDDVACPYKDIGRRSSGSFRVPMLIWLGSEYEQKHPAITTKLSIQTKQPHISTVIPQTLLDIALIRTIGVRSPSLLDKASYESRPVFSPTAGWVDFDQAEKNNRCNLGILQ